MFKSIKPLLWALCLAAALLAGTIGYFGTAKYLPLLRKPSLLSPAAQAGDKHRVSPKTVIRLERKFLCGDIEAGKLPVTPELLDLDMAGLKEKFAEVDGWSVEGTLPDSVVLRRREWDVCTKHRTFRHLGDVDGTLAIFEGPLGVNQTLLQKEDILVANLPLELQKKLEQAKKYSRLIPEAQKQLQESIEFGSDSELNEFLDNLDEYRVE